MYKAPRGIYDSVIACVRDKGSYSDSGVNIARTRSFPGADIGNDHDLLILVSFGMNKNYIIVFRKGGYIAARERWTYSGVVMPVVNVYKYLGIYFTTRLFRFCL